MIPCRKVLEALSDYLDDALAAAVRRDLEAHLAECRTCQVIYDTSRRTLRIVTDVSTFEIPGEVSERLLQRTMAGVAEAAARRAGRTGEGGPAAGGSDVRDPAAGNPPPDDGCDGSGI